jgi:hypothetical protein
VGEKWREELKKQARITFPSAGRDERRERAKMLEKVVVALPYKARVDLFRTDERRHGEGPDVRALEDALIEHESDWG